MPHVRLKTVKHIRRSGVQRSYQPGDVVEVGNQAAIEWLLDGSAEDPFCQVGPPPVSGPRSGEYGLRILSNSEDVSLAPVGALAKSLTISYGPPAIPCKYTVLWNPKKHISANLINLGFYRVLEDSDTAVGWEMAAGLVSLDTLARDFGSVVEREKTEALIGDLRLPVYEPGLIWARKCEGSERMISLWNEELKAQADPYHSFLRALYTSRVMLCTLPADWASR